MSRVLLNPMSARGRALAIFLALVTGLGAIYMITYSGRILSGDELYLFDAAGSATRFGDFLLDVTAGTRPPQSFELLSRYPLPPVDAEPLQILLASPLYWLADHLPRVGLVHAVWLFNVVVGAVSGGVLYLYARTLGYGDRTAVAGGLALGLGTVVWPYTKSFFREPLAMLLLLAAGLCIERWRQTRYHGLLWALLGVAALAGAALTKAPAVLAVPALLLIALPAPRQINRRVLAVIGVMIVLIGALFVALALFGEQLGVGERYDPLARFMRESRDYLPTALQAYLLSIGGSVWGTSPVVLLALPGMWMLYRQGKARYIAVVLLGVLIFAAGYAAFTGRFWFGGLSWPPRFLVPVVPFLVLGVLPVFERLMHRPVSRGLLAATIAILAYSVWVQLSGVTLDWGAYTEGLPPEAGGLLEWSGGLNDARYLRWVVIPSLWGRVPLDFAWLRAGLPWWPAAFGLLAAASFAVLWRLVRGARRTRMMAAGLPLVLVALTGAGLAALYPDPYYAPDRPGLFPMLSLVDRETGPGDVLLLSNREYESFFLNYGKVDDVRVVGLSDQPGDRPSEGQLPEVESDSADLLLDKLVIGMIHSFAETRETLWLLENKGPDFPWAVRPVERFMAAHYYPIRVVQTEPPDPTVRLIEYSTVDAPDPLGFRNPDSLTDLVWGERVQLVGYDLPAGAVFRPGDVLPISFSWRLLDRVEEDYRVAWFLRSMEGAPIAQGWDSRPGGDFEATSEWLPGVPHWDNRALRLPERLPPGEYRLWVKVYAVDEAFAPRDLNVNGTDTLDGVIGVLPTVIRVE